MWRAAFCFNLQPPSSVISACGSWVKAEAAHRDGGARASVPASAAPDCPWPCQAHASRCGPLRARGTCARKTPTCSSDMEVPRAPRVSRVSRWGTGKISVNLPADLLRQNIYLEANHYWYTKEATSKDQSTASLTSRRHSTIRR